MTGTEADIPVGTLVRIMAGEFVGRKGTVVRNCTFPSNQWVAVTVDDEQYPYFIERNVLQRSEAGR